MVTGTSRVMITTSMNFSGSTRNQNLYSCLPEQQELTDHNTSSSRVRISKASAFHFISQTVCSPYPPLNLQRFQSPLYGSGTVFRSISHLLCHFSSSALTWRHTSSNYVTRNYCCYADEVTLLFMDTLIALIYLLTESRLGRCPLNFSSPFHQIFSYRPWHHVFLRRPFVYLLPLPSLCNI